MNKESSNDGKGVPISREEGLAARAVDLMKAGTPKIERLIALTRPRVRIVEKQVVRYLREHESELKETARQLARARLRGPLGLVVDSLTSSSSKADKLILKCSACRTSNPPRARFCNECGVRLEPVVGPD